jgi:hypothetical protein
MEKPHLRRISPGTMDVKMIMKTQVTHMMKSGDAWLIFGGKNTGWSASMFSVTLSL